MLKSPLPAPPTGHILLIKFLGGKKAGGVFPNQNPAENKSDVNEIFDVVPGPGI